MYVWMDVWMHGCMDVCMYGCWMHACTHASVYASAYYVQCTYDAYVHIYIDRNRYSCRYRHVRRQKVVYKVFCS